jgi:iron complex outermembrane receptor protein
MRGGHFGEVVSSVCLVAIATPAAAQAHRFEINAGPLSHVLGSYVRQSGRQVIFRGSEMEGVNSKGAHGTLTPDEALTRILDGTGFYSKEDASGSATAIVRRNPGAAAPADGSSADAPPLLDDIVVTARRKEEQLQRVPIAISALSGSQLQAQGIQKVADVTTAVTGVFSAPGSNRGSNSPVFAIRGQLNRDPTLGADPSVGIYFAEVPWARPQGANAAFFDLQSLQVLKGPQGTLFGRNSTAGAILLTPNAPTDTFEGYVKDGLGTYDQAMAEAVLNMPLSPRAAIRIGGTYERRDGYLTNVLSGQKLNNVNNGSVRIALKLDPTDGITTTFIGSYYKTDTNGDGSRLIGISPASPSAPVAGIYARLASALARTNALGKYNILSSFAPEVAAVDVLGVPQVFRTSQSAKVETWSAQNSLVIDLGESPLLGDVSLKNIIGYRHEKDENTFETAAVPFLNAQVYNTQHSEQFSEELQLQGKRGAIDYVIGGFYFR